MSNVIVDKNKIDLLANAISAKSGEPLTLTLDEMVEAVDGIEVGGGGVAPTGTILITTNGTQDVTNYAIADVQVPQPTGNINISQVGVTDVTQYASATVPSAEFNPTVGGQYSVNPHKWRLSGGGYAESSGWIDEGGYETSQDYDYIDANTSITPTESSQTIGGADVMMAGAVTVNAISSTYVGSGITRRSSSDLTASGATVSVPSGYYENNASKAVASGSATPASSISGTSATVSTGTNTLTLSKTVSNTPQVSAGYVSSGTAGNSNVSLTANVTTKAAATIYPSASDQSIASGTYLTGAQTIKGVTYSNLTADNIKKNVMVTIGDSADADRILSVTGTYEGGGGGGMGDLLSTTTIGAYSTSSTSSTNMNISTVATNINAYDLLLVETSVDTKVANRHMATVAAVFLLNSTNASTKNASAIATVKWNAKLSSSSVTQTTSSTSAYGIYPSSCTITTASNGTATFPMYSRYNSTRSGTINGNYKTRIYGVKLCELIGG